MLSEEYLKSRIEQVDYQVMTLCGKAMMYCGIKLYGSEFVAVGKPATLMNSDDWDDETGKQVSYENTFEKLWELEAYRIMSEKK